MKITLSIADIIDGVYANSVLTAMALEAPDGIIAFVLSPAHEDALRRMAHDAFAAATALAGGSWQALESADTDRLEILCVDELYADPATCAIQLRAAVTALIIHMIFASANAPQAAAALSTAKSILSNLSQRHATLPSLSPAS